MIGDGGCNRLRCTKNERIEGSGPSGGGEHAIGDILVDDADGVGSDTRKDGRLGADPFDTTCSFGSCGGGIGVDGGRGRGMGCCDETDGVGFRVEGKDWLGTIGGEGFDETWGGGGGEGGGETWRGVMKRGGEAGGDCGVEVTGGGAGGAQEDGESVLEVEGVGGGGWVCCSEYCVGEHVAAMVGGDREGEGECGGRGEGGRGGGGMVSNVE